MAYFPAQLLSILDHLYQLEIVHTFSSLLKVPRRYYTRLSTLNQSRPVLGHNLVENLFSELRSLPNQNSGGTCDLE